MIMGTTELYILIAVFALLTIALVWFGGKTLLDMFRRQQSQRRNKSSHHPKR